MPIHDSHVVVVVLATLLHYEAVMATQTTPETFTAHEVRMYKLAEDAYNQRRLAVIQRFIVIGISSASLILLVCNMFCNPLLSKFKEFLDKYIPRRKPEGSSSSKSKYGPVQTTDPENRFVIEMTEEL